jgi:hypothetical protein
VSDIRIDGCQQILLGEFLAMLTRSIGYCLANNIDILVSGASGYQSIYAEQRPDAMEFFTALCHEYGITLAAPVLAYESEQEVKDELLMAGLSGKSLEASTILSDLETAESAAAVLPYLQRKLLIVHDYLAKYLLAIPQGDSGDRSPDTLR